MPLAGAGIRRHLRLSAACGARVGAAESFVSFIPLFGGMQFKKPFLVRGRRRVVSVIPRELKNLAAAAARSDDPNLGDAPDR
jgi:hypothetical protein